MTPRVRMGPGAVGLLPEVLGGARRLLVVHGMRSYREGPAAAAVDGLGAEVRHYAGVRPNPSLEQAAEAVALAREYAPDAVVGIGGGSAMDVAKCVAVLAGCSGDLRSYLSAPATLPERRSTALVQVPTISGSGSELTRFATVYDGHRKLSLDHAAARADHVLIDPDLAATVPARTAAASALDALAQAVESAWAVAATRQSRALAVRALTTLVPVLDESAHRGDFTDPGLRSELARGAALAGAAIDTSRTTAAHALSYALTARHGIAHGAAVGLHLRWLIGHNAAVTDADNRHPDGAEAVRHIIGAMQQTCRDGTGGPLEELIDRLLRMHGLRDTRVPYRDWRDDLSSGRAGNNPRLLGPQDVLANTGSPAQPGPAAGRRAAGPDGTAHR
ncbi:iron-containing alcohol dehydrogenase [Streptomyces sp. NRRL F-5123]|uniref:iron-containing alcohol dehydrogenase n=1 Tax=Streptomyces sp. NRRL F-5123 TaxID=1463856 RepID=UPI000693647E|nr:iron-containing alcohol dehydrogenase [Streptomyces sp. NRRL F-5123]